MNKLTGKIAIVTGASRGIGRAIAINLAMEGASIVVNYSKDKEGAKETVEKIKKIGGTAIEIKKNISSYKETEELVKEVIDTFGKIDILVNNAGISKIGLFMDATREEIDNVINTNLLGTMYLTRNVIPFMINKGGSIVNISSMWGEVGASCEVLYSTSKGGINLFTKALAKEMAPSNIRVNAVAPGVIDTKMNSFLNNAEKEELINEIPMGRFGLPEEIAKAVVFLCSDDSSYLTGEVIKIDGGYI
ncbi:MAG: SDR family oxidoreductase [Clostridiales bacterium]|nr:SDR family oxidoreductase [Clostridiales bacterium]